MTELYDRRTEITSRFARFTADSIRFDKLVNAHLGDAEYIRFGGEIKYTPDKSFWTFLFYPVTGGGAHKGRSSLAVEGFAEVFAETDRSIEGFVPDSSLTGIQVSGMLGKVLVDQIFDPKGPDAHQPDFFLTDASREGLSEILNRVLGDIKYLQSDRLRKEDELVFVQLAVALRNIFKDGATSKEFTKLAVHFYNNHKAVSAPLYTDKMVLNLKERLGIYNEIGLFDWDYLQNIVKKRELDEETFGLEVFDIDLVNNLSAEYYTRLQHRFPRSGSTIDTDHQFRAMGQVLALNSIVGKKANTRFIYLTTTDWSIRYFDRFFWDASKDDPLVTDDSLRDVPSVSSLFVRHPVCFLPDIDLRGTREEPFSSLAQLVDTIVPRAFVSEQTLSVDKRHLENVVKRSLASYPDEQLEAHNTQLSSFFEHWRKKKMPWVDVFWEQRAKTWNASLEALDTSKESFRKFWHKINRDLARETWPLGIYLSLTTEKHPGRAAPLVFIDCEDDTNMLLRDLQEGVYSRKFPDLQNAIQNFNKTSEARHDYFNYLVNAVVFMAANQFSTADTLVSLATEVAYVSGSAVITGREAYYLRSLLTRINAQEKNDLDSAKRLMLIAKSKLEEDNRMLASDKKVSRVRFDLEDWSREIVQGLFDSLKASPIKPLSGEILQRYLAYMTRAVENEFATISADEKHALFQKICEKAKFNFLVLCVSTDRFPGQNEPQTNADRAALIGEWNERLGTRWAELVIKVTSDELDSLSMIEEAYYLAICCACHGTGFATFDGNLRKRIVELYGPEGIGAFDKVKPARRQKELRSALTSSIDEVRYNQLKLFCFSAIAESGV